LDLTSLEFKLSFLTEADSLIEQFEKELLALESGTGDADAVLNELFRLAHNLKGSAQLVGFQDFSVLAHRVEDGLLSLKNKQVMLNSECITVLLKSLDCFTSMRDALKQNPEATFDNSALMSEIDRMRTGQMGGATAPAIKPESAPPIAVPSSDNPGFAEAEPEAAAPQFVSIPPPIEASVSPKVEDGDRTPSEKEEVIHAEGAHSPAPAKAKEGEQLRVAMSKIELLNNLVGELVILHSVLDQRRYQHIKDPLTNKTIGQLGKLSKEIQDISMSLRMTPLKTTFQKMTRIVRDTSQQLNKKATLAIRGEDTEIDKTLVDALNDPLVHIIRNAIDHGLETPEERIQRGKPPEGTVRMAAYHEGNKICINIADDGNGIDTERVLKKAIDKKLVSPGAKLNHEQILALLFAPGFSTKEAVTDISGRGVGMDVVKTNIEGMGGTVTIRTELGKWSAFKILLPITTAIIDGMVVRSGSLKYVIPLAQIQESLRPRPETIHLVSGVGNCLHLRGEVIPLCDLNQTLGHGKRTSTDEDDGRIAIIVRSEELAFAVQVDDILMQQQVVIKKLGKEIRNQKGIMGSAILGDGRPSFILDLVELYGATVRNRSAA
jgi:two-component system, chemotaxis family, sensor kinase CheA